MSRVMMVVSGPPVAGQRTWARRVSPQWGLPVVSRDTFGELLVDTLGTGDPPRVDPKTLTLCTHPGRPVLVENTARATEGPWLRALAHSADYRCRPIVVTRRTRRLRPGFGSVRSTGTVTRGTGTSTTRANWPSHRDPGSTHGRASTSGPIFHRVRGRRDGDGVPALWLASPVRAWRQHVRRCWRN
jgi:hypothetical protein